MIGKLTIAVACLSLPLGAANALPVIPGASGFGMDTPAGRGGKVIKVTNLNESGSGSLRACVDVSGPRVCVFEVSGTIRLRGDVSINNPYLTIAGQTAPSPGITIRGHALWVKTHDVLIQHLRFRGGDVDIANPDNHNVLKISSGGGGNASPRNVVIANNSLSWGIDQLMDNYADTSTFYRNIFSEALHDSLHSKGRHGMGPLLMSRADNGVRVTMHGNLLAHNNARNPLSRAGHLVFVNNIVYNWGNIGTDLQGEHGVVTRNSFVGNTYRPGPNSSSMPFNMRGRGDSLDMTPGSKVYIEDNVLPGGNASDPWSQVRMGSTLNNTYRASSPPVWNTGLKARPASEGFEWVLETAGARPADRDSVDTRVTKEVRDRNGRIINSQRDVGGWPAMAENRRTLTLPSNPNGDDNGNGYTNLEEWLHAMAAEVEGAAQKGETAPPSAPQGLRVQ